MESDREVQDGRLGLYLAAHGGVVGFGWVQLYGGAEWRLMGVLTVFNRWLNGSQKGGDLVQGGGSFSLHFSFVFWCWT